MKVKKFISLTLKMLINSHLLVFLFLMMIFHLVIKLDNILAISISSSLFSCFAFYEIESLDSLSGLNKVIAAINNGKSKIRISRNFVFFLLTTIGSFASFLTEDGMEKVLLAIISYCICLSIWYFVYLVIDNPVVVFSFSIVYVFFWMVYYKRFIVVYLNPFYLVQSNLNMYILCGWTVLSMIILGVSVFLHRNRYSQNFTI